MRPKLTTVALPHYELGRKAVEVLFAGEEAEPGRVHRVAMPVRYRDSVSEARDRGPRDQAVPDPG